MKVVSLFLKFLKWFFDNSFKIWFTLLMWAILFNLFSCQSERVFVEKKDSVIVTQKTVFDSIKVFEHSKRDTLIINNEKVFTRIIKSFDTVFVKQVLKQDTVFVINYYEQKQVEKPVNVESKTSHVLKWIVYTVFSLAFIVVIIGSFKLLWKK